MLNLKLIWGKFDDQEENNYPRDRFVHDVIHFNCHRFDESTIELHEGCDWHWGN